MIPLALAFAAGLSTGPAVDLDTLTVQQAASIHGQVVRATVTVVNPPDAVGRWTVAGDDSGAVVRSAVLPKGLRINRGDVLTVVGVLELVRHPATVVNGENVPAWDEVRVTGGRVR